MQKVVETIITVTEHNNTFKDLPFPVFLSVKTLWIKFVRIVEYI